ncbi:hypothetical protein JW968_03770 [Candidatus Woesearchaeota archaeon]|nr:hypothetical protein [Candidatus Woesearchaeota archaeon]
MKKILIPVALILMLAIFISGCSKPAPDTGDQAGDEITGQDAQAGEIDEVDTDISDIDKDLEDLENMDLDSELETLEQDLQI